MKMTYLKFIKNNFKKICVQSIFWFIYSLKKHPDSQENKRVTISQKKFYKHGLMDDLSASARITTFNLFKGEINAKLFEQAINYVFSQHEIFNTTFYMENNELYYQVHEKQWIAVQTMDLSHSHNHESIEKVCFQLASEPFSPEKLPLYKISIVLMPNHYFKIIFCFHHMIIDGWSLYLLQDKVCKAYAQLVEQKTLPSLSKVAQFSDYIFIENMSNAWFEKSRLVFWKQYLEKATPLNLPFLNKNNALSKKAENINALMSKKTTNRLKAFKNTLGVSNNTVLLATFFTILYRYSQQETITVIIPRFSRFHPKQQAIIGPMLDGLPLILHMNDEMTFIDVINQLKEVMHLVMSHDDIPFDYIVDKLQANFPLNLDFFKNAVIFNYISVEWRSHMELKNASYIKEGFIATSLSNLMNYYVVGECINGEQIFSNQITVQTECMDNTTAHFFIEQYLELLQNMIDTPNQSIGKYPLLTHYLELKLPDLTQDLNQTETPLLTDSLIHTFIKNKDRRAIEVDGQKHTYQDLLDMVLLMYSALKTFKNHEVAVISGRRNLLWHAALISLLFLNKPFCLLDETADKNALQDRLDELNNTLVLASSSLTEPMLSIIKDMQLPYAKLDELILNKKPVVIEDLQQASATIEPYSLCYIIFTSGSTSKPKAIYGNHIGLSHFINWQVGHFALNNRDICAQITNVHFDVCLREVFSPLVSGAKLLVPDNSIVNTSFTFLDWLEKENVTIIHIVPSLFNIILQNSTDICGHKLRSIRYIFFAGEALTLSLVSTIQNLFCNYGVIVNLYGPSETTLAKVYYLVPDKPVCQIMPIGKAMPGCQIFIMNKGRFCGICEPGEIVIRTPFKTNLAPDKNRLLPNPHPDCFNESFYQTGDLGLIKPNGEIAIIGRIDSMSKINGVRIDLNKIQQQLMEIPYVKDCCVTVNTNESQTMQLLVAHVVLNKEKQLELTASMINNQLKKQSTSITTPHVYNVMEKLPRLSSHKIDKVKLTALKIEALNTLRTDDLSEVVGATTITEQKIHALLAAITKQNALSCDKMFEQLGISSLQLVQFLMQLQHEFTKPISLQIILKYNSIQQLGQYLDEKCTIERSVTPLTGLTSHYLEQYSALPALTQAGKVKSVKGQSKKILLTGATGFLGKFLLIEVLTQFPDAMIYCLIRASDNEHALARLNELLSPPFDLSSQKYRLKPVLGDLDKEHFAIEKTEFKFLQSTIDLIIHCGAHVNFLSDFHTLSPANVDGTKSIIQLAAYRKIPIHYVSTAGIFPGRQDWENKKIDEHINIHFEDKYPLIGGYAQTKWVAELLMQKARDLGIPVSIYRFGRISGDLVTGHWPAHDFVMAYLMSMTQLGIAPNLATKIEMVPVDVGAKMMIRACSMGVYANQTYHIINPNQISFNELKLLFKQIRFDLEIVDYKTWKSKLEQAVLEGKINALTRFLPLFPPTIEDLPRLQFNRMFSNKTLEPVINKTDIQFPILTSELLAFYLQKNDANPSKQDKHIG